MNDDIISKADLWAYRIHAFQESGLSRKDWCQQNEIPQSTLGYWIRRLQSETPETECTADPVFAKLPTEQELQFNSPAGTSPITILLPENIRIEVGADCPSRLMAALLQALKSYVIFRKPQRLSGMRGYRSHQSYTGAAAIIKPPNSISARTPAVCSHSAIADAH